MSAWGLSAARNIRSAAVQITKRALSGGWHMSKAEEFRQYAEEAVCWSINPRPNKEKQAFMDLARTWTQAAVLVSALRSSGSTREHRAP